MLTTAVVNEIHNMSPDKHIVIGTILRKFQKVKLNENKNGIMVNASTLPQEAVTEVMQYLEYLQKQENILSKIEKETDDAKQYIKAER